MHKIRVLLADAHETMRHNLARFLKAQTDVELVAEATSGLEALARVGDSAPDVAFVDVRMPRRSGLASIREIKRRYPSTKVFLMSFEERVMGKLFQEKEVDGLIDKASMKQSLLSILSSERERRNAPRSTGDSGNSNT